MGGVGCRLKHNPLLHLHCAERKGRKKRYYREGKPCQENPKTVAFDQDVSELFGITRKKAEMKNISFCLRALVSNGALRNVDTFTEKGKRERKRKPKKGVRMSISFHPLFPPFAEGKNR